MIFYPRTGNCYLFMGEQTFNWSDGWDYCKTCHPDGHLMDIQSEEEEEIAFILKGKSS